jgi:UDP-N-acetylmuramoylalanine--D-glutamate ligase
MEVLILGKGKSGLAAAELLERKGYKAFLYDDRDGGKLLDNPSFVVKSPGISQDHEIVSFYKGKGIRYKN